MLLMKQKLNIFSFFKIFLLSGLYLSFFIVQLFFNFDLANNQKSNLDNVGYQSIETGLQSHAFYQKPTVSSKANIRLNKRFEPKSFPYCFAPIIEIDFIYLSPINLAQCGEQSFISHINLSTPLRGPPSIA